MTVVKSKITYCILLLTTHLCGMNQSIDLSQESCAICLETFKPKQLIASLHRNSHPHYFHEDCILEAYEKDHKNCPCCRATITLSECFGSLSRHQKRRMIISEFIIGSLSPLMHSCNFIICSFIPNNGDFNTWVLEKVRLKIVDKLFATNNDFHFKQRRELFKNERSLKYPRWFGSAVGITPLLWFLSWYWSKLGDK